MQNMFHAKLIAEPFVLPTGDVVPAKVVTVEMHPNRHYEFSPPVSLTLPSLGVLNGINSIEVKNDRVLSVWFATPTELFLPPVNSLARVKSLSLSPEGAVLGAYITIPVPVTADQITHIISGYCAWDAHGMLMYAENYTDSHLKQYISNVHPRS